MSDLLLVYTMGKVASTTVSESLIKSGIECHDVHTLIKSSLINQMQKSVESGNIPSNHIGRSINIFRRFQHAEKVKIVTCVRDSFSRNISAVFQNLPEKDYSISALQGIIEKTDPDIPGTWFKNQFAQATGIDIFEKPFDIVACGNEHR